MQAGNTISSRIEVSMVATDVLERVTHIWLDARGVAWVDDTNVKVIEIVLDRLAYGWSPEEIHFQHPDLSLAQIHAALSHYYDHEEKLDAEIKSQLREVERMAAQAKDSPFRRRLRAMGKLR